MGNVVPFPGGEDRHLVVGQQALAAKDYASAAAHLDKAYAEQPTFETARLLVQALDGLQAANDALPYIGRHIESFLKTTADQQLMIDTLVAVPDYRSAWAITHYFEQAMQQQAQTQIAAAETKDLQRHADVIDDLRKRVAHLGGLAFHEQEALLSELGRLPKSVALQAIPPLLVDVDVHAAIRVSLLDALTAFSTDQPVDFRSYIGVKSVVPDALTGVMNDQTITQMVQQASTLITDADEREATLEMLRLELGFLYPFVAESIPDQTAFVEGFVHHEHGVDPELEDWLENQIAALINQA